MLPEVIALRIESFLDRKPLGDKTKGSQKNLGTGLDYKNKIRQANEYSGEDIQLLDFCFQLQDCTYRLLSTYLNIYCTRSRSMSVERYLRTKIEKKEHALPLL